MSNYSNEKLNDILGHFALPQKNYLVEPLTDGLINDTFLVREQKVPLFILQRVNNQIFTDLNGLMNNIQQAFKYLQAADYTKITLIPTKEGFNHYTTGSGNHWRVMTYIDGSTAYNNANNTYIAFEAGRIISKFHLLLENADLNEFVDTIPYFHSVKHRKLQFESALGNASQEKQKIAENALVFTGQILEKLNVLDFSQLPLRICHNDTKLNNILFSKETEKALCLIDLDTLMKGYFMYDFGDAVRTVANTAAEDEQDHSKIIFNQKLFDAFIDGLAENATFLTKPEVETLSWGAILIPFLHGLRALTDYLNGNIYYKVAYENQNLDRALSLYNFTEKALENRDYMHRTIQEKLG